MWLSEWTWAVSFVSPLLVASIFALKRKTFTLFAINRDSHRTMAWNDARSYLLSKMQRQNHMVSDIVVITKWQRIHLNKAHGFSYRPLIISVRFGLHFSSLSIVPFDDVESLAMLSAELRYAHQNGSKIKSVVVVWCWCCSKIWNERDASECMDFWRMEPKRKKKKKQTNGSHTIRLLWTDAVFDNYIEYL